MCNWNWWFCGRQSGKARLSLPQPVLIEHFDRLVDLGYPSCWVVKRFQQTVAQVGEVILADRIRSSWGRDREQDYHYQQHYRQIMNRNPITQTGTSDREESERDGRRNPRIFAHACEIAIEAVTYQSRGRSCAEPSRWWSVGVFRSWSAAKTKGKVRRTAQNKLMVSEYRRQGRVTHQHGYKIRYNYHCKQGLECTAIIATEQNIFFTCMQNSAPEIDEEKSSLMVKTHCENGLFKATFAMIILLTRLKNRRDFLCNLGPVEVWPSAMKRTYLAQVWGELGETNVPLSMEPNRDVEHGLCWEQSPHTCE